MGGGHKNQAVVPSLCLVLLALDLFLTSFHCADLCLLSGPISLRQDGPLPAESRFYD